MTEYSKFNMIYRLQKWMDSVPGQTFLNYAYSWGAAVVILGTLFKLTHIPGANFMLFLGMGTEVVVFFLAAFDRPFDKEADGKELPTHAFIDNEEGENAEEIESDEAQAGVNIAGGGIGGGTIIINGGGSGGATATSEGSNANNGTVVEGGQQVAAVAGGAWIGQQQENTPEMAEAQGNYVEALNNLTEMLQKVGDQSQRLTRDSEEMENLNRTLTGIVKVYEMQLKSVSQQIGTIDQINEQTRNMAQLIEQLNSIYARMIEAMTVNMRVAAPGAAPTGE